MGLDDLVSTESAVVAGVTAAVFSPRVRETVRKGTVFGVAGVLKVGDVVTGAARGAVRGVKGDEHAPTGSMEGSNGVTADEPGPRRRRTTTPKATAES